MTEASRWKCRRCAGRCRLQKSQKAQSGAGYPLKLSIFLTSAGVDIVRRGASDMTHVSPLEPLADMLRDFFARGSSLWAPPARRLSRG